jgi:MFS transporter, DHA3 family, macrolide efflux protein
MESSEKFWFLNNKFLRVIIGSNILLQMGIWIRNFAILLYVMEKTNNNPLAVSLISVAEFSPIFIFSFIGGTFADRWRPKLTMVLCDLFSSISVFLVLLAIIFKTWQAVFFVTFISAILSQFSQPSSMKLFKVHIPAEKLQSAMAMFQTLMAIFIIIGPLLGTFVYQRLGINIAIGMMGLAFLLSASVLVFLPNDERKQKAKIESSFKREFKEGIKYVYERKALMTLGGTFALAGLAVGITQTLGIFIVVERLGLPKENLQWLLAVFGISMLIGGGVIMSLSQKFSPQKLLAIGLLVNAISVIGMGVSTNFVLTCAFQFLNGFFMPCIQVGINTLILKLTDMDFIGRVNGVLNPMFMGAMVITISLSGWLKVQLSLVDMYIVSGVLFLLGALLTASLFKLNFTVNEQQRL